MIMSEQTMCLIYPGMTDFVTVTVIMPAPEAGFVMVRDQHGEISKVSVGRLVSKAVAEARRETKVIERDGYTVTERTVKAVW